LRGWLQLSLSPFQARLAERLASRRPVQVERPEAIHCGVALVLVPDPDAILIIRRATRVGDPWSGQMGLPGGRHDPRDSDLLATARRETLEEVGVCLEDTAVLGTLDDLAPLTPVPRLVLVRPFVFALPERPSLTLSDEVAEAMWTEVAELRRAETYRDIRLLLRGEERVFPAYHLGPHAVWGLTERILTPLLQLSGS
jgi:8-oxo-dGTP pyrophosphatase MutT (NUDIX family)